MIILVKYTIILYYGNILYTIILYYIGTILVYTNIPANPVSRRRQNGPASLSRFAFRASETLFFYFHSDKNAFLPAATNESEHVHFAWQAQCFVMVGKEPF